MPVHKNASIWQQFCLYMGYGLKIEFSVRERLLAPLLFAATILIVIAFCFATTAQIENRVFVAEIYLAVFLALQVSGLRLLEYEQRSGVLTLLCTYPITREIIYLSKFLLYMLTSMLVLIPALALTYLFNARPLTGEFWYMLGIACLVLIGLAALGVLLSTLVMRSSSRHLLYPLLYFPLTIPLLIAAAEVSLAFLTHGQLNDEQLQWITLLLGFDVIYFTLGILLFGELLE